MADPFFRPDLDPPKKRRITEGPPLVTARPEQEEPVDEVAEVFNDYGRVANKAKALAQQVAREARKFTIPVSEFATEVRAAVRRKDQFTSDGSLITFDLFRDALAVMEKRRNSVDLDQLTDLTGNVIADSKKLEQMVSQADNPDLDGERLAMFASNLMVLYVLNQMLGPWKAVDTAQMTAPKQPPGTEVGSLVAQTIIGVVMQLLIAGLQEQAIEGFLKRTGVEQQTGIKPSQFIAQAKGRQLNELQDLAQRKMGESDYDLILDYVKDFITQTAEPGYELWSAYWEARHIRQVSMSTWRGAPQYSMLHAMARYAGWPDRRAHQGPYEEPIDIESAVDVSLRNALEASVVTVAPEHLCTLREQVNGFDRSLDMIGQVAAMRVTRDAVCCLVRYLGKIDPNTLRALRAALRVLLSIQNKIAHLSLSNFAANFLDFLEEELKIQLRDLVMRFLHKVFDPVEQFLYDPSDEEWQALFACPLIKDMVDHLIRLSVELRLTVRDLVDSFVIDFRTETLNMQERWANFYSGKKLRLFLLVLEQVLQTLEHGNLCGEDDEATYNEITEGLPPVPAVDFDPDVVAEFFQDSEPIEIEYRQGSVEIRDTIPSMKDPKIDLGSSEEAVEVRCRKAFGSIIDQLGTT